MCRGGRNSGRLLTNTLVSRGHRSRTACDTGWAPQASGIIQPEAAPVSAHRLASQLDPVTAIVEHLRPAVRPDDAREQ